MNESLKKFFETLAEDEELAGKLEACKSVDEAYELAIDKVGGEFSKDEFIECLEQMNKAADGDDISADDLAKVAGGDGIMQKFKQKTDKIFYKKPWDN